MEGKLKRLIPSLIIALTSVILQLAGKHFYFDTNSIPYDHFLYTFTHANIFHLSLNLIALFQFKPRVKTCLIGYVSCVLASFVPLASLPVPTCGMSGFIMGCYARRYHAYTKPLENNIEQYRHGVYPLIQLEDTLAVIPNSLYHLWSHTEN